jgi:hypothetical protein
MYIYTGSYTYKYSIGTSTLQYTYSKSKHVFLFISWHIVFKGPWHEIFDLLFV